MFLEHEHVLNISQPYTYKIMFHHIVPGVFANYSHALEHHKNPKHFTSCFFTRLFATDHLYERYVILSGSVRFFRNTKRQSPRQWIIPKLTRVCPEYISFVVFYHTRATLSDVVIISSVYINKSGNIFSFSTSKCPRYNFHYFYFVCFWPLLVFCAVTLVGDI